VQLLSGLHRTVAADGRNTASIAPRSPAAPALGCAAARVNALVIEAIGAAWGRPGLPTELPDCQSSPPVVILPWHAWICERPILAHLHAFEPRDGQPKPDNFA